MTIKKYDFTCAKCKRQFKNAAGLSAHMRFSKTCGKPRKRKKDPRYVTVSQKKYTEVIAPQIEKMANSFKPMPTLSYVEKVNHKLKCISLKYGVDEQAVIAMAHDGVIKVQFRLDGE